MKIFREYFFNRATDEIKKILYKSKENLED